MEAAPAAAEEAEVVVAEEVEDVAAEAVVEEVVVAEAEVVAAADTSLRHCICPEIIRSGACNVAPLLFSQPWPRHCHQTYILTKEIAVPNYRPVPG